MGDPAADRRALTRPTRLADLSASLRPVLPGLANRVERPELLDQPGHDPAVLADNLADLRRVNRWLGGVTLTLRALERLTDRHPPEAELTILDLGTGGADLPVAIRAWARRRGRAVRLVATDVSVEILALARRAAPTDVLLAGADARRLPFADGGVDVAICSLLLHHLAPPDAVAMLGEMRRVSRRGVVVNDLVRSWWAFLGALALGRLATHNPMTRHDGPLSVLRAYTGAEMIQLGTRAGLSLAPAGSFLGHRVALVAEVR